MKPAERKLAAQLSGGSPGMALTVDLEESTRLRRGVLRLLEQAADGQHHHDMFAATAQLAKDEKESFENLLELFYSVLADLLEMSHGPKSSIPRNPDLRQELESLSKRIDNAWVERAADGLDRLHGRLRRNINRQLGLDALAVSLGGR